MRARKHLALLTRADGTFMNEFHVPSLEQHALHSTSVQEQSMDEGDPSMDDDDDNDDGDDGDASDDGDE
jgi:hypothetical protein